MKERLKVFGLLGLYWIIFFIVCRAAFLFYHLDQTGLLTWREIVTLFFLGLRMDLAMTGYWLIIPGLLLMVPLQGLRAVYYVQNAFTILFLFISSIIVLTDLELYKHWGFRINRTPLSYISSEALQSIHLRSLILLLILFAFIFASFLIIYLKFISKKMLALKPMGWRWVPVMFLITGSLIIPIRSSFSVAPLNSGVVYFHATKSFPNHAGINATWNFFNSVLAQKDQRYPADLCEEEEAQATLKEMVKNENPSARLFLQAKPDILVIILESFTSKIIAPLGGLSDVTPNFNRLVRDGILFDHFYASGDRTDKGLVSVLSGYPAQPLSSIINYPEKTQHLPHLSRFLEELGYHNSFVYGGDIGFANMESYLTTGGFSNITEDDDFDNRLDNSKWGVPDHYVFERLLQECDTAHHPFFKVMLSLSSHEPFEVPMEPVIKGNDERSLFLNACYYTDKSLGEFIQQAQQQPWWNTTVVLITSDHGHRFPNSTQELKEKDRFKIPLLWLGGALAKRDTVVHTLAGQTDIANTLLAQLDKTQPDFKFSKNVLDKKARSFAIYVFNNGYGFIDPSGESIYDFDFKNFIEQGSQENLKMGKGYIQALFNDYNLK